VAPVDELPVDYELLEVLHQGHHSQVVKCRSRSNGELCVVKRTIAELVSVDALHALQRLRLSNILTPRHIWTSDSHVYEELPFLDGMLLSKAVLRRVGGLTGSMLVSCHAQLMAILAELHGAGLIFRDIHPDNLFLVRYPLPEAAEGAKASWRHGDVFGTRLRFPGWAQEPEARNPFGVAWVLADSTFVATVDEAGRRPPVIHGSATPEEQAVGQPTTASDMYALGATLYFGITGREIPAFADRRAGRDISSYPDGSHDSVSFATHLRRLLALAPEARPSANQTLDVNTVASGYTGTMQVGAQEFVLIDQFATRTRVATAREALDFHRAAHFDDSEMWQSHIEKSMEPAEA